MYIDLEKKSSKDKVKSDEKRQSQSLVDYKQKIMEINSEE